MILKNYQLNKINLKDSKLILLYGKNEGLKNQTIKEILKEQKNIINYDEKEILDNSKVFIDGLSSKSLFENERVIIVKRTTDKILNIINEIKELVLEDILIILNADILEKKSKLRAFFEKDKKSICIAFYPDTEQTLSKLTYDFFKKKNISISPSNTNMIVSKCNGDREALSNELNKIEFFCKNGKKINSENIAKLTNLAENYSISELIDSCLVKNRRKVISILNESNFSNEDCMVITRSFIIKAKKLLALSETFEANKNIDLTISSAKPPIFWKEKEITKQQIYKWKPKNIKQLIYELGGIELQIKKNINNSINVITDFILGQFPGETNS